VTVGKVKLSMICGKVFLIGKCPAGSFRILKEETTGGLLHNMRFYDSMLVNSWPS
jgi:hypothetical protein